MLVTDQAAPTTAPSPAQTRSPALDLEGSEGHLLRLCLDLQLDSMLLTLGALAVDPGPDGGGGIPWRRWITEDVDLACALAADALAGHAALPPTLGSDLGHAVPVTAIDDLVARYSSMRGLLADLARSGGHPGADELIARCDARLSELREHKLVATPPSGIDMRGEQRFLPGELLG
jgi:hypothetical protein